MLHPTTSEELRSLQLRKKRFEEASRKTQTHVAQTSDTVANCSEPSTLEKLKTKIADLKSRWNAFSFFKKNRTPLSRSQHANYGATDDDDRASVCSLRTVREK